MGSFSESFVESANKTAAIGASAQADLIKERIKNNSEKRKSEEMFDIIASKIGEGKTPEEQKALIKKIEALKKVGLSPSETLSAGKLMAPDLFQDDTAKAIREQTLIQKQQQNALTDLPQGLTPLSKDSSPEEKSAFLDKLPPEIAANVQGVANYDLDPTKIASMRTGERAALISAAKMFDPTFDMKKYPQQQSYIKKLGDTQRGTIGGSINAANTLIQHMDLLDQSIEKLKNTNVKPANAIINLAKDLSGDPSITDYTQAQSVVNSELENLLTGVGATQEGLRARDQLLSKNAGYDQMKSAIKTIGHIMQARTHSLEQQYKEVMGKDPGDTILHADSKKILNRIYGNSNTKMVNGTLYEKRDDGKWYPKA